LAARGAHRTVVRHGFRRQQPGDYFVAAMVVGVIVALNIVLLYLTSGGVK
jgi:hypothetical protein